MICRMVVSETLLHRYVFNFTALAQKFDWDRWHSNQLIAAMNLIFHSERRTASSKMTRNKACCDTAAMHKISNRVFSERHGSSAKLCAQSSEALSLTPSSDYSSCPSACSRLSRSRRCTI